MAERQAAADDVPAVERARDGLIDAVLAIWEGEGATGISARRIAREGGAPVSSIYNRFASLKRLFEAAQGAAQAEAVAWAETQRDTLQALRPVPPAARGALFAALVEDWVERHRRAAFAWRECYLLATRDHQFQPLWRGWCRLWEAFWVDAAALCDLDPAAAPLCACLFDSACLIEMMEPRDPASRAALASFAGGWSAWIDHRLAGDDGFWGAMRDRAEAGRVAGAPRDATGARLATAAAALADRVGLAGLTYRGVAAEAGVTLGVVAARFATSDDLVRAAMEAIYERSVLAGEVPPIDLAPAQVIEGFVRYRMSDGQRLAFDALLLAVARDPGLRGLARQLRFLRGRSTGSVLRALIAPRLPGPLDFALFSALMTGQLRANLGLHADTARARLRETLAALGARLGGD